MPNLRTAVPALFMLTSALGACGQSDDTAGVGGVTAGEARALNEAAEILDERAEKIESALSGNQSE